MRRGFSDWTQCIIHLLLLTTFIITICSGALANSQLVAISLPQTVPIPQQHLPHHALSVAWTSAQYRLQWRSNNNSAGSRLSLRSLITFSNGHSFLL
jgi:hypothetical protein